MTTQQILTGDLTESRVKQKLESLGFIVEKPVPDVGIDFIVTNPANNKQAKIQVKGRNPLKITSYRWFQLRVRKDELTAAKQKGLPAQTTWQDKVRLVDFFILDAVHFNEMWVLSQSQTMEVIKLNEHQYGRRPDNVFVFETPQNSKQKEVNLEAIVTGIPIMERYKHCKDNFRPILEFVGL